MLELYMVKMKYIRNLTNIDYKNIMSVLSQHKKKEEFWWYNFNINSGLISHSLLRGGLFGREIDIASNGVNPNNYKTNLIDLSA